MSLRSKDVSVPGLGIGIGNPQDQGNLIYAEGVAQAEEAGPSMIPSRRRE